MSESEIQNEIVHVDNGETPGRLTRQQKILIKKNIMLMDKWQRERDKLMEMECPEDEQAEKAHFARLKQLTQGISRGYKELVSGPAAPYLRDDHKVDWAEYVRPCTHTCAHSTRVCRLRKDVDVLHLEEPLRTGGGHD
jgi:hypothetical protein